MGSTATRLESITVLAAPLGPEAGRGQLLCAADAAASGKLTEKAPHARPAGTSSTAIKTFERISGAPSGNRKTASERTHASQPAPSSGHNLPAMDAAAPS